MSKDGLAFANAERIVQEGIDDNIYSGAALGIIQAGEVVYENYFGNVSFEEGAEPINNMTKFDLASITKIFSTTSIALRFLDRGLIRLYDTVGYFFPEATTVKDITIKELMTHTSGQDGSYRLSKETDDPANVLHVVLNKEPVVERGTVRYSCMGMIILGHILQKVSGKTLDQLFQEEVKDILGVENVSYGPIDLTNASVAKTRDLDTAELLQGQVHDENARFQAGVSANAGLFSNLQDLLVYANTLLNYGDTTDGERFISSASLDLARTNYTADQGEFRGLGFLIPIGNNSSYGDMLSEFAYGHTGFTGTSLVVDPYNDLVVVFLSNRVISVNDGTEAIRRRALLHNSIVADVVV